MHANLDFKTHPRVIYPACLHQNDPLHELDSSGPQPSVDLWRPYKFEYPCLCLREDVPWLAIVTVHRSLHLFVNIHALLHNVGCATHRDRNSNAYTVGKHCTTTFTVPMFPSFSSPARISRDWSATITNQVSTFRCTRSVYSTNGSRTLCARVRAQIRLAHREVK